MTMWFFFKSSLVCSCNSTPLLYDHNFFSCPIFSNPHTLFITFTRSSLDSFRWRDFSVSSSVKLQLRGTTTDSGTASPSLVWFQSSSLIPQTTNRSRIVNLFHIWISLRSTNQKICSVYVKCKQGHHEEAYTSPHILWFWVLEDLLKQ